MCLVAKIWSVSCFSPELYAQRGKKKRLAAENRARTSSGECQQLLAKAIEGDKEREVRTLSK